jgi:toxin ParE1/3/4
VAKKYRVEITATAEHDASGIYEYIARDSTSRAVEWFREIVKQEKILSNFPRRCPVIPESSDVGVEYRHLIWGNYRTVFRIHGDTVYIVRIIHGAQLLDTSILEA